MYFGYLQMARVIHSEVPVSVVTFELKLCTEILTHPPVLTTDVQWQPFILCTAEIDNHRIALNLSRLPFEYFSMVTR